MARRSCSVLFRSSSVVRFTCSVVAESSVALEAVPSADLEMRAMSLDRLSNT